MPADSPDLLHDVFISYARKDANLGAAPLDAALKSAHTVWRDIRGIDPSQDFTAEIEKAIKASRRVVVCVTPDVERDDSFVRREIAYASYLKKPILVARFADIAPPINVFTHTWIDFFKGWDDALARLLSWLGGEAVATARAEPAPALPADPYKPYLEILYEEIIDTLRVSVFSEDTITLRAVESVGDVARKTRRINPKFITHTLRETPEPDPIPQHFDSLHDAYAHARCDGRVLLLGEPGAGKTTTLLAFARDAAAARLSDLSNPLPVFARIAGWNSLDQTPLTEWLAAMYPELKPPALHSLIETGSALLLLDGLDELGSRRPLDPNDPAKGDYDPRERFLKALPPTGKLILSSRVEEYRDIHQQAALNCAVRLEPLDDAQMQSYLADVPDLWPIIAADASLKDALRTPLLLALFRVGFEESPEEARALRDLTTGDLNDRIWDVFIDRRWAFEQARTHDPLPYSTAELKASLGEAIISASGDREVNNRTHIFAMHMREGKMIDFALRLGLLVAEGYQETERESAGGTTFYFTVSVYRLLHLLLRNTLMFSTAVMNLHNPNQRSRAAEVLGELGDARAVEPLIVVLHESDRNGRSSVVHALGELGDARAVEPLIAVLRDSDEFVRSRAADVLGELADSRAVEPLIAALHDPDKDVSSRAAQALGKLGDARAVEPLIAALHDPNDFVRSSTAHALGELGDARAVEPLIAALHDPQWLVRNYAADALSMLGDDRAIEPLIAILQDPDEDVRVSAIVALGKLADARAVEPLIAALHDPQRAVRVSAADALGELGDARAVEPLITAQRDPKGYVRVSATDALVKLGETAVEPLITALHDPGEDVRSYAAKTLGRLGDARAVEPLIAALQDPVHWVRRETADALREFPDHPAAQQALADYEAGKLPPRTE